MEFKTLSIGSIIRYQNEIYMIVGYDYQEKENKIEKNYIVVPYPRGYRTESDYGLVPAMDVKTLWRGYESQKSNIIQLYFDSMDDVMSRISVSKLNQLTEIAEKGGES